MTNIMLGVRPACLGMVAGVCITLSGTNYMDGGALSLPSLIIAGTDALLLMKFKVGIPWVIALSAAMGLLFFGLMPL